MKLTARLLLVAAVLSLAFGPFASIPGARAQGPYAVVILVVDDFGETDLAALDPGDYGPGATCAVSLEGQAFAVRGVSADPIDEAHGDLVMAQIEEMLADVGSPIPLVPVEIQGLTTDQVAGALLDAVAAHPADVYVINMSFAIIPCEHIQAFAEFGGLMLSARDAKDLNRYRGLFKRSVLFYDDTVFPVMSQKAQNAQDLDPLQTALVSLGAQAIPVAAAGNFGLDYPFWPGAWGQVISVSAAQGEGYASPPWEKKKDTPLLTAETDNPGKQNRISNYGEVMLPGEYSAAAGVLSGTSFAAPRLSVVLARYAAAVGPAVCRTGDGRPALATGNWDNLTLAQAAQAHCPDLLPFVP